MSSLKAKLLLVYKMGRKFKPMRKKKTKKIPPKPYDEYPVGSKTWVEIRTKEIASRDLQRLLTSAVKDDGPEVTGGGRQRESVRGNR